MSRRKKSSLGDVSSRELLRRTEQAIGRAHEQVASGDCGGALDNMIDAGILLGTAEASLTGTRGTEVGVLVELDRELIDVREGFLGKCICSREPGSRPLTFRRGRR